MPRAEPRRKIRPREDARPLDRWKNFQIRRNDATVVLGGRGLIWIRPAVHKLKLQYRLRLHDVLHARRIVHARKLDQISFCPGPPCF